jgi:hypothetical protein
MLVLPKTEKKQKPDKQKTTKGQVMENYSTVIKVHLRSWQFSYFLEGYGRNLIKCCQH